MLCIFLRHLIVSKNKKIRQTKFTKTSSVYFYITVDEIPISDIQQYNIEHWENSQIKYIPFINSKN